MINFYLIRSKERKYYTECINSFNATTPKGIFFTEVDELSIREETLNFIFKINLGQDMVCFSDDIVFTKGWYEIILDNLRDKRAIGFSMKNPSNEKLLNHGFDLVSEDNQIKTRARVEWISGQGNEPNLHKCASFTGCFFSLAAACFSIVDNVPLEGNNRLGELIYHILLARGGGEVLVSSHILGHYSVSTKNSSKNTFTSQSYQDEKKIWDECNIKYNLDAFASIKLISFFSDLPKNLPRNVVIWGAGSIAKKLIAEYGLDVNFFISGLEEEYNKTFINKKIFYYKHIKFKKIDNVLITVEGMQKNIQSLINQYLDVENIYFTNILDKNNKRWYSIEKL